MQTAYQVQVASSATGLKKEKPDVWDSGKVDSAQSVLVPYGGDPLKSHSWCFWRVRVWDAEGKVSKWSPVGRWAMGVLAANDWKAAWLAGRGERQAGAPSMWFRRTFELDERGIESALCSVASVGYHELYVNGRKVGDDVMAPAISDLSKRALFVTRDIAPYLHKGTNVIAVWLGQGWAGHNGKAWYAGSQLDWAGDYKFLLRADVIGKSQRAEVTSGSGWRVHQANTDSSYPPKQHNLGGELVDERLSIVDWAEAKYDDHAWAFAQPVACRLEVSPQVVQCNRIIDELHPIAIRETKPGVYQADMGRHFSGWIEVQTHEVPNTRVEISMSEHGEDPVTYGQQNLLITGTNTPGIFRNHFKHQSGRWITVKGLAAPLKPEQVKGHAISTGYERTGGFKCSDDFYNRLYETVLWTFRQISLGGYVVDCPHRERMGYGDGINTVQGAMLAFDAAPFFTKWSRDWRDVQQPDGNEPFTAPTYNGGGGPMWSSTLVHLPWLNYVYYGDRRAMEGNYSAICRWMSFLEAHCTNDVLQWVAGPKNIVQPEWSFLGDWVYPGHQQAPNGHDRESLFMNNCYYLHTLKAVANIAQALGRTGDAEKYGQRAQAVAAAVHREFWDAEKRSYPGERQTTPASALFAGLPPEELKAATIEQLAQRIEAKKHLDTGILGTYFMIEALTDAERSELVDCVASAQDAPGWGAMMAKGATCIWEQWDGGNSRCHSSYLSIGDWFIKGVVGIRPDAGQAGFKHFVVRPGLCERLRYAEGSCASPYGKIACKWKRDGDNFTLEITVPVNTSATAFMPASDFESVKEGGKSAAGRAGVRGVKAAGDGVVMELGSGTYRFSARLEKQSAKL